MEYELAFGKYIKHSETLLEAIAYEGVDVDADADAAEESNRLLDRIMTKPYGVLVNLTHNFSFDFKGAANIGSSPYEKRVAILTFRPSSELAMTTVIQAQEMSFPDKELCFFDDRAEALAWLGKLPSQ